MSCSSYINQESSRIQPRLFIQGVTSVIESKTTENFRKKGGHDIKNKDRLKVKAEQVGGHLCSVLDLFLNMGAPPANTAAIFLSDPAKASHSAAIFSLGSHDKFQQFS